MNALPEAVRDKINEAIELTKNNSGIVLNVAFNYGGRDEIVTAVKNMVSDIQNGKLDEQKIS